MTKTLFACLLVLSVVALAQDAGIAPVTPTEAVAVARDLTSDEVVSGLDAHWKTRDSAESLKAADELMRNGVKLFPNDYEILWRASRVRWWAADGTPEEKPRKQFAKEGWNYAQRAVTVKEGAEGKYYLALCIGAYSQAVGILKALGEGLEGKFVENIDFAIKSNESFDLYGPILSKGRYHFELPWPKRDIKKSKELYEKVLSKEPNRFRAHYFLAELLLKDGDAKTAKVHIDKVFSIPENVNPPEAKRVRKWAKTVKEEIEKELQ